MKNKKNKKQEPIENTIIVENFYKRYEELEVGPFSFSIEKNKITALLGSNGSGKSVFLKSLMGTTTSYQGTIVINGKERRKYNSIKINAEIALFSQMDFSIYTVSIWEFLKHMCVTMGIEWIVGELKITHWLKKFDLWKERSKPLNGLSWTKKYYINLILTFLKEPKILIINEPGFNLDAKAKAQTFAILNEFKQENACTIILLMNIIDEVYDIIDNYVVLQKGQLLFSGSKVGLNLYKKIKLNFEQGTKLDNVEKILNQHDLLTFDLKESSHSMIVGLKLNQSFEDVLSVLHSQNIKLSKAMGLPIGIKEVEKALKDQQHSHVPNYGLKLDIEPSNQTLIDNFSVEDLAYDEVLNEFEKTIVAPFDLTYQPDVLTYDNSELEDIFLFLEKIEDKYEKIITFDEDLPSFEDFEEL